MRQTAYAYGRFDSGDSHTFWSFVDVDTSTKRSGVSDCGEHSMTKIIVLEYRWTSGARAVKFFSYSDDGKYLNKNCTGHDYT